MNTPLVSVIMSTLNTKEEYLKEAVNSILSQTYTNFEFIIIVDGGMDDEILLKFQDERIKIIKHDESIGLTKSLNEAIKECKGKYIARMDSDDIALKDRFRIQVAYMEKNPEIDMTATFYKEIGENEKTTIECFNKPKQIDAKLFYINMILHPSVMFKKEFLNTHHITYDENYIYSQDFELWTRIAKKGNIQIIPKILMKYRIHEAQISTGKFQKQSEIYCQILKRNLKELNLEEENIKYILMLNTRNNEVDIVALKEFIKKAIDKNSEIKRYDEKIFKKVLKVAFATILVKQKKIVTIDFLKYGIYLFFLFGKKIWYSLIGIL